MKLSSEDKQKMNCPQPTFNMQIEKTHNAQFGKCVKRYLSFVREHNDLQTESKETWLREPHLSKYKAITTFYLKNYWNMMNSPLWADSDILPMIETTRQDLANICGCKSKAVYNHLARLSSVGIIEIETLNRGKKGDREVIKVNGYRISLNLFFLLGIEDFKPEMKKMKPLEVRIIKRTASYKLQTLPDLLNPYEILNKKDIAASVENLHQERHQEINQEKGKTATPAVSEQEKSDIIYQENQEKYTGGAEISGKSETEVFSEQNWAEVVRKQLEGEIQSTEIVSTPHENWNDYRNRRRQEFKYIRPKKPAITISEVDKMRIVDNFWNYAKNIFYPNRDFEPIRKKITDLIRSDVFNNFEGNDDPTFWQIESLKLQSWAEKKAKFDENKSRVAYFPLNYFAKSYGNREKQGFLVVKIWKFKHDKSLKEMEFDRILESAKRSMTLYPTTGIIPRGQKDKIVNIQQLAQYWFRSVASRTNHEFTEQFKNFLQTQNFTQKSWQIQQV